MKALAISLVFATAAFSQSPAPVRGTTVIGPVRGHLHLSTPVVPWWHNAERERIRTLGSPVFFEFRSFPGRPDLGNPQMPQFPKPLW